MTPRNRRKRDEVRLDATVNIRITTSDAERLDKVADGISIGSRHAIARAALRIGLAALERDPGLLLVDEPDGDKTRRRPLRARAR